MRPGSKIRTLRAALVWLALAILLAVVIFQMPAVKKRFAWRLDLALTYLRGIIQPAGPIPTPLPLPTFTPGVSPTAMPTATATQALPTAAPTEATPTLTPSPTPLPAAVALNPPPYVKQDPNNCGPATLAMALAYYGWQGNQDNIAEEIKPLDADRNVNPEEMAYYVRNFAGWLNVEYRVGGDLFRLKQLIAAGFPVIIEESFYFEDPFWPNDDLWAAHYLLLTGYDDAEQVFIGQDSYRGPDQRVGYAKMDADWKIFNRVYMIVFLPQQQNQLQAILGEEWDVRANRQHALQVAQAEAEQNPQDAFAWFNIGTNLVFFERYLEASQAFDTARNIGLPQRMLRYQFTPFFAYFHSGRNEELLALTDYALQRTPNSEEALLWKGWGMYRKGDTIKAIELFRKALEANPKGQDARYALNFVGAAP